jgi:hypothetical protein
MRDYKAVYAARVIQLNAGGKDIANILNTGNRKAVQSLPNEPLLNHASTIRAI